MAQVNNSVLANVIKGTANPSGRAAPQERAQSDIFVNVGVEIEINGEMKLLSLPFGLPLDTMNPLTIRGQNEEWNQEATVRNELLQALVKMGQGLEPGEGVIQSGLKVQIYRRKEQTETPVNNALLGAVLSALGSK